MALLKWEKAVASALRIARNRPGVLGVDFGFVYKDGVRLNSRGVRFHVGKKVPVNELPPDHILPATINEVRSDVVEVKYSLHASAREVCDPMQPGVSIGNLSRTTTGTMGSQVTERHTGRAAFISNWHVTYYVALPQRKVGNRFPSLVLCTWEAKQLETIID